MVRHDRGTSQTSLESFWLGTPFVKVERDSEKITINTYIYFEIKGTRWKYVSLLKYWNNQKSTTLSQTCVESHVFWTSSVLIIAALSSLTIFFSVSFFTILKFPFMIVGFFSFKNSWNCCAIQSETVVFAFLTGNRNFNVVTKE